MDVAAVAAAVAVLLGDAAKQREDEGVLLRLEAVDGRGEAAAQALVDARVLAERENLVLVLRREHDFLELLLLELDRDALQDLVELDLDLRALPALLGREDAVEDDAVAGSDGVDQVVLEVDGQALGLGAAAQAFRGLLNLHFLVVDEAGLLLAHRPR